MRGGDFVWVKPTEAAGASVRFNQRPVIVEATQDKPARITKGDWEFCRKNCVGSNGKPLLELTEPPRKKFFKEE